MSPYKLKRPLLCLTFLAATACYAVTTSEKINTAAGLPIVGTESLWSESIDAVAARLSLPLESKTDQESSFRSYPAEGALLFGARPYSIALYGEAGKPTRLSVMFINRGDFGNLTQLDAAIANAKGAEKAALKAEYRKRESEYPAAFKREQQLLLDKLTAVLGPPSPIRGDEISKERGLRWDFDNYTLFLVASGEEYIALRILRSDLADQEQQKLRDSEIKKLLKSRVQKRQNGDVLVTQVPMVDQGPKGFCVPATIERVLRYMGIPADLYVIARAAGTDAVEGTRVDKALEVTSRIAASNRRKVSSFSSNVRTNNVAKAIDDGVPILWVMFRDEALDKVITDRSKQRTQFQQDAEAWKDVLKNWKKIAPKPERDRENGHVCLIIGYNETTGELAVSDSYGPGYEERWITEEEASAFSGGEMYVITH